MNKKKKKYKWKKHPYPNEAVKRALDRAAKSAECAIVLHNAGCKDSLRLLPTMIRDLYGLFDWNTKPPRKWSTWKEHKEK